MPAGEGGWTGFLFYGDAVWQLAILSDGDLLLSRAGGVTRMLRARYLI